MQREGPTVEVSVQEDNVVTVKASCPCTISRNYAASVDCGWALTSDPARCMRHLSELITPEIQEICRPCYGHPETGGVVRNLIACGLLDDGNPPEIKSPGYGAQITLYASGGGQTDMESALEQERAIQALADPQEGESLMTGVSRGTQASASFRNMAAQGQLGRTMQMEQQLKQYGASVAAVTSLDMSENPEINYGKVSATKEPPAGVAQSDYNAFKLPQLQSAQLLNTPTVFLRNRYDSTDNRAAVNDAWRAGLIHPAWYDGDIYLDFVPSKSYTKIEGTSHGAAILLTLMGYTTDTVVSASVSLNPETGDIRLGPVSQLTAKAKWCEKQNLKVITHTTAYKAYPDRSVNQLDLDRGYKAILSSRPDGTTSDSLWSGQFLYAINNSATLFSLARDPRMVGGTLEEPKRTALAKLAQIARDEGGGEIKPKFDYDFLGERGTVSVTREIETEEDVKALADELRQIYAREWGGVAYNIFKAFNPTLTSVVGQVPWNDETNQPAKPGEKSFRKKYGIKTSFLTSLDNLMKQVEAATKPKEGGGKKKKKGGGGYQLQYEGLLEGIV